MRPPLTVPHWVKPMPEPQRFVPSSKVEQTKPERQSSSLEHLSHSSPPLRQPERAASEASTTAAARRLVLITIRLEL